MFDDVGLRLLIWVRLAVEDAAYSWSSLGDILNAAVATF